MTWALLIVAAFAPAAAALAVATRVSVSAHRAARAVVGGCAVAAAAATALLVASGLQADGRLGDAEWLGVDRASALLLFVVLGTSTVVAAFSRRSLDDDGRAGRYFAGLGVVASGSALVVLPGSPALLLAGWVAAGWALVALVGYASDWSPARAAQLRILRTLLVGDVALLAALVVLVGTTSGPFGAPPAEAAEELAAATLVGVPAIDVVAVLLVVAGLCRSSIFPFHRWLIGTINAPAPVSALVHAGFVSGAGLLLFRFGPIFVRSDAAVILAFALAVATLAIATGAGAMRSDTKGGLAWSTVAQMAFMVVQVAVGAFSSALFHIAGHGMYKAALFLGAGDTVSAGLRERRRPRPGRILSAGARWEAIVLTATGSVALAMWAIPPDVNAAGAVLIAVFAWASIAFGLQGWLRRGPLAPPAAVLSGAAAALTSAFAYVGGLRAVEYFVAPSIVGFGGDTVIGPWALAATLAGVVAVIGVIRLGGRVGLPDLEATAQQLVARITTPGVGTAGAATSSWSAPAPEPSDTTRRASLSADVDQAGDIVAPQWPLASFVAVNPLARLEPKGFDEASAIARRWLRARTHLSLDEYRADHGRGLTTLADLEYAALDRFLEISAREPLDLGGRSVDPLEVVVADLLHGPDAEVVTEPRTALERAGRDDLAELVDRAATRLLTAHVAPPAWPLVRPGESVVVAAKRAAVGDPVLRRWVDPGARQWLRGLADDPAAVLDASLAVCGVADDDRVDELRGHLARVQGWAGLARWRNEWSPHDDPHPQLTPIEMIAVRALCEALVIGSRADSGEPASDPVVADGDLLARRVAAVAAVLAPGADDEAIHQIASVLDDVPAESRASVWLAAQEHHFDALLLDELERPAPASSGERPNAQVVFCIDVRSEGLRRHLEEFQGIETRGFAGFFGVPMAIRRLGWEHDEPRCPVLVSPALTAREHATAHGIGDAAAELGRQRALAGMNSAHAAAKRSPGAPFVLAETLGWLLGPLAAKRTLWPGRAAAPSASPTRMAFDDDATLVEQRVFLAESVLTTMGLTSNFASLVVLCGHTSITTNNPHATALECGACAGAAGDDNARAVAALLNSGDVRHGLAERGITIPDDTWFAAGLHDTASDQVSIIDEPHAPPAFSQRLAVLQRQLDAAGRCQASRRAVDLPGAVGRVRDRGADWAQVRPEWGLARNAAFVIGPRSLTEGLDLGGRAFLHSYDEADDPTGRVLETIMTAPLVVGHWISSQYYFSTVDPEVFGAGDKLLHNPIGVTGVMSGDGGDLRVGLPLQSTHVDGRRFHQPVRLLAVIQADLARIEDVIANNPILQTLTAGSWLRIAGRSGFDEPWSTRTSAGTWITSHRGFDIPDSFTSPGPRADDPIGVAS